VSEAEIDAKRSPDAKSPGGDSARRPATRLQGWGMTPIPPGAMQAIAGNRRTLSFLSDSLVCLIDDLLKAESQAVKADAALYPDLRLGGDNPHDASRYLLRGLRNELRNFDASLSAMERDPNAPRLRLANLRDHAIAVAQMFSAAPRIGASRSILAQIGAILSESGLMPWADFLQRFSGTHSGAWVSVDVPALRPKAPAQAPAARFTRKAKDENKVKPKAKAKGKNKPKGKGKAKKKAKKAAAARAATGA
jgi:hypothetical protein